MRELDTERLFLRKLHMSDVQAVYDNWAKDTEVTRYLSWQPHVNTEATRSILMQWVAEYHDPDCFRYGIERKSDHALMGMIDVWEIKDGIPEIGYASGKQYWNRGYMTEALEALLNELKEHGYNKIHIRAAAENTGSNRVIEKNGFRLISQSSEPNEFNPSGLLINYYEKNLSK